VRVAHLLEQDLRRRRPVPRSRFGERGDERLEILFQQVVTEVHHEVVVAEELPGDQHAVRQPERLVLGNERDLRTELGSIPQIGHHLVAGVADDHTEFGDAGGDHRTDAVVQDRRVGHRDQLLGPGVSDRPQPRAGTAGENERLHDRRECRASRRQRTAQPPTSGAGPTPRK